MFSAMRARTIFLTSSIGSGLSAVNRIVPVEVASNGLSSAANCLITALLPGNRLRCFFIAP